MTRPEPGWKLLGYEYDPCLLRAAYERPDGEVDFQTFDVPERTLHALVAALLAHADQNERTEILRAEVVRNDEAMAARYSAMPVPDWLPAPFRDGHTLR